MSFQLPSTEEKADYVMQQFDRIAGKYDLANDLISIGMHRLWKARAINEMLQGSCSSAKQATEESAEQDKLTPDKRNESPRAAVTNAASFRAEQATEERAEQATEERAEQDKLTPDKLTPDKRNESPRRAVTNAASFRAEQATEERAEQDKLTPDKRNESPRRAVTNAASFRAEQATEERAERIYLDLCTGTGDLALMIADRLKENDKVVGLDFSREMLSVARQREKASSGRKRAQLEWQQGDAQNLPFPDNYFDAAIISFGLRNLTDLQKGLCEMSRVVKPGGIVVNLDLGQPDMPIFTPLFLFFFEKIVPIIGELIQQDRKAYTYLPESRKNYPHPLKLSRMFEAAGLADVRWIKLACGSVALHVGKVK